MNKRIIEIAKEYKNKIMDNWKILLVGLITILVSVLLTVLPFILVIWFIHWLFF